MATIPTYVSKAQEQELTHDAPTDLLCCVAFL
jgi:hypothetical protein